MNKSGNKGSTEAPTGGLPGATDEAGEWIAPAAPLSLLLRALGVEPSDETTVPLQFSDGGTCDVELRPRAAAGADVELVCKQIAPWGAAESHRLEPYAVVLESAAEWLPFHASPETGFRVEVPADKLFDANSRWLLRILKTPRLAERTVAGRAVLEHVNPPESGTPGGWPPQRAFRTLWSVSAEERYRTYCEFDADPVRPASRDDMWWYRLPVARNVARHVADVEARVRTRGRRWRDFGPSAVMLDDCLMLQLPAGEFDLGSRVELRWKSDREQLCGPGVFHELPPRLLAGIAELPSRWFSKRAIQIVLAALVIGITGGVVLFWNAKLQPSAGPALRGSAPRDIGSEVEAELRKAAAAGFERGEVATAMATLDAAYELALGSPNRHLACRVLQLRLALMIEFRPAQDVDYQGMFEAVTALEACKRDIVETHLSKGTPRDLATAWNQEADLQNTTGFVYLTRFKDQLRRDDLHRARELFEASVRNRKRAGHTKRGLAWALRNLAEVERVEHGANERVVHLLERALACLRADQSPRNRSYYLAGVLTDLAIANLELGRNSEVWTQFDEAAALAMDHGPELLRVLTWYHGFAIASALGNAERAATYRGQLEAALESDTDPQAGSPMRYLHHIRKHYRGIVDGTQNPRDALIVNDGLGRTAYPASDS